MDYGSASLDVEARLRAWRWLNRGGIGGGMADGCVFGGVWSLWGMVGVCHCCCRGLTISFIARTAAAFGLHYGRVVV